MGHRLDRVMYNVSVIYIALPIYIFLATWLRLIVAFPMGIIFVISCIFLFRNKPAEIEWHLTKGQRTVVMISILLLVVWLYFSGLGGFSFQNSDYHARNAIFHDLIHKSWPVIYDYSAQAGAPDKAMLTYYIAYWLPAAAVGKLFGWVAANVFLYFWSLLGGVLIVYYLFRTLRNARVWSVLILIFFSGADLLGYLWLTKGALPGLMEHIEWWSGFQYSSNTTLLYWVFNQTIVMWLAILLVLNLSNSRSLFFLYAMLLLHGPFPFVGMLPIVLWKAYEGYSLGFGKKDVPHMNPVFEIAKWFWGGIRRALTFENVFGGISVLLISYLYLSKNVSGSKSGMNHFSFYLILFFFFDIGIYLWILYADHKKNPLYWICLISLVLIPFFRVGVSQDFCMRVSIPALFMVQILVQKSLLGKEDPKAEPENAALPARNRRGMKIMLIVFLVIGMTVPIEEITRSTTYTLLANPSTHAIVVNIGSGLADTNIPVLSKYGQDLSAQGWVGMLWADSVGSLAYNKDTSMNFVGPTEGNHFYQYLARQS